MDDREKIEAMLAAAQAEAERLREVLGPCALLGGPMDGFPAYQDLPDCTVVYSNSGEAITAGDVRLARRALAGEVDRATMSVTELIARIKRGEKWELATMPTVAASQHDLVCRHNDALKADNARLRAALAPVLFFWQLRRSAPANDRQCNAEAWSIIEQAAELAGEVPK